MTYLLLASFLSFSLCLSVSGHGRRFHNIYDRSKEHVFTPSEFKVQANQKIT